MSLGRIRPKGILHGPRQRLVCFKAEAAPYSLAGVWFCVVTLCLYNLAFQNGHQGEAYVQRCPGERQEVLTLLRQSAPWSVVNADPSPRMLLGPYCVQGIACSCLWSLDIRTALQQFEVDEDVAFQSQTVKNLVEDAGVEDAIPLPNVSGEGGILHQYLSWGQTIVSYFQPGQALANPACAPLGACNVCTRLHFAEAQALRCTCGPVTLCLFIVFHTQGAFWPRSLSTAGST